MAINPKPRGGKRPGAGRKRGVRDRATGEQRASLEELAKAHTEAALATLHRVCTTSESDAAAVSAATALLDRGYGKPRQAVEMTGKGGGPIEYSDVRDRLAHLIDREATKGDPAADNPTTH